MKIQKNYSYQNPIIKFLVQIIDFFGEIFFFWVRKNKPINKEFVKKILVVKLDHIGDGFVMLPFLDALKEIFKNAKINVLVSKWTKEIYQFNPAINKIIIYDYFRTSRQLKRKFNFLKIIQLIKNLKKEKYDLFIDACGEPFIALLSFLSGTKYRLGFTGDEFGSFFYTHSVAYNKNIYEGDKYLNILKFFDYKKELSVSKLFSPEQEKERVKQIIRLQFKNKIIGLHLTSGLSYKIWPIENFAELINKINKNYPLFDFVVLGSKNDKIYVENLKKIVGIKIQDLTGLLNIRETYYFLSRCNLFIGNDSVLAHFTASLNVPTIEIFNNAVNKKRWAAKGQNVYLIEGKAVNHRCPTKHCLYPCPNMKAISVEKVFEICDKIIKEV